MGNLFENAIQSIKLGVADYEAHEPARALSAVRNFYAGLLLLAKEILVRKVPNANESEIIGTAYKPVPDSSGGVRYVSQSKKTIDLATIGLRFKDFGLTIDQKALNELSNIRNDIEHRYPTEPYASVRQALAKAFPVAVALFRLAGEEPSKVIGEAWETMLEVHEVYEQEHDACRVTFDNIEWRPPFLKNAPRTCPDCQSDLVAQDNPDNREQEDAKAHCRSCGSSIGAEALIHHALNAHFEHKNYVAKMDGDVAPLNHCPECGSFTYVWDEESTGCIQCGYILDDECARCGTKLTPDDAYYDNRSYCSWCGYMMAKDD